MQNRFQRWYFRNAWALILVAYVGGMFLWMFSWAGRLWRKVWGTPKIDFASLSKLVGEDVTLEVKYLNYQLGPWTTTSVRFNGPEIVIFYKIIEKPNNSTALEETKVECVGKEPLTVMFRGCKVVEITRSRLGRAVKDPKLSASSYLALAMFRFLLRGRLNVSSEPR
ncbi:MAG: hypothetical protein WCK46_00545 [Candidatus Adlerbacteria bacterium]